MPGDVMENEEIGRGSSGGSSGSSRDRGSGAGSGGGGGGGDDIAGSESSGGVSDEVTQTSLLRDEHARMWRKSFIQCDGFGAILHLLLCNNINGRSSGGGGGEEEEEDRLASSTSQRPTIVERTGLSLALRLSKFFLVGMLRQRGIEVKDDRQSPLSTVNGDSHDTSPSSDDTDTDDSTVVADDDTDDEHEEMEGKKGGESKRGRAKTKKREGKDGGGEEGNVRQQRPSAVSIGSDHERTSVGSAPASPATSVTSSPTTMTRPPLLRSFR
jgi:hypothetical protein